ncbi:hypothetical protein A2962_00650 [Candidatus Woesebacteria bacterium RIFCSPLOWO2_01_FULL_39_61]|uniref:Addiction module toxin RelE n=1 Tax=Candidatus Woesebacteria bacterium RIFCSPHIGHO2_02_FULL_39_13 TaxID=1802505 RepID=A0A1F7Z1Y1_9BACT|nr:MAG: hypothetical protein A2692_04780 [Candidatus Woesebacteria bacterium RIFCSPHIGHO2_01_FULL_39_95]OGM33582.1 MAG: hypothetical protein A3D01_01345 [Candidatus Woesebacteria bacterium RIFCSPHIGHO2_02_FULL_39_13]OGM36688.1 MAG: hypothetical protein A3E13_00145 [Candidatus Woesebacteria bacterium RIFCSPHIGHO2_12_FULL_40_20]OGM68561.1 MAG: hypothetical protein A2962_00650 [Candidatus Woesebacteria bacterium RIFCSPLOWO2_01_FULL_39_61]OGM75032.1 MAG: hypothetical protein A3H19_02105 [Candidatus
MEVVVTPQAKKQIKKLSKVTQILIVEKLKKLELGILVNFQKLSGYKGAFRVRVGNYRIVYRLLKGKAYVVLVGHRKEIYLLLRKLLG